jgi:hypothetical protein
LIDDGKLHEQMARATRAKLLLEDELFLETFKAARDELVAKMVATSDQKDVIRCHDELKALERVLKRLHKAFDDGKVAAHELEYREKVKRK